MMNDRNKYRVLVWLVVIFFATSVSMGVSFFYHKKQESRAIEQAVEEAIELPAQQRTRFFRDELNLEAEQMAVFRDLNRDFNRSAWQISNQLEQLRIEMVEELGDQNPDIQHLESITQQVGELHSELKELTVDYYIGMKNVCTPEQQTRLNEIFMSVLQQNEDVRLPQGGRRIENNRFLD